MRNSYLIKNLGPTLLHDHSFRPRTGDWNARFDGLVFWVTLLGLLSCIGYGIVHAESGGSDPLVMKIYPDGTKVVLRWSEVGKAVDNGEKFGGAPRIVAYDPAKDGIVPIGEPSQKTETTASNPSMPASASVVAPEPPAKMDYTNADPKDFENAMGPAEGFVFRTAVGAAFQQPLSGRSNDGSQYLSVAFNPGLRFDLEPAYNVTDWFRVGVETAFIYNTVQRLSIDDENTYPRDDTTGNSGLFQVPILANVCFQFPSEGPWKGYLGGGVGAGWDLWQISANDLTYTSYHWNFMYQLTAGFTYTISPGFDLDIGYKMLSAPNPSFQNSGTLGGAIDPGQFKASYNHTVEVGLAWRF